MKTENHSINDVLAKNATSFFIPPFQRAYAWGKPEIERYFSDILRIIESEMDIKQNDKLEHFFGTIVIKEEKAGFANKSIVVDGQQRLTTTLIFLIALRDIELDKEKKEYLTQNYLTNNLSTFQDKIKLKQVTKDWEVYRALVNQKSTLPGIISNAYQIFYKLLSDKKKTKPQICFEHYITAIRRMNVAVIFLDERPFKGEDPQIIFETLNSLGRPLTLSDLIRNFVLLNMDSNNQSDIYEKTWHPHIEEPLYESTSEFFRDYLQYKTSSPVKAVSDNNTKEIYQIFKSFVDKNFPEHKYFIEDIVRYIKLYKWIIYESYPDIITADKIKDKEIKELLRNIFHDIKTEAFKPFVMGILYYHQDSKISDDLLISFLKTIRSYMMRRRVIGLTQGENKSIVLLSSRIQELSQAKVSMIDLLSNMFYKMRFPNDNEMRLALETISFYEQLRKYAKFILGKIEEAKTKVSVDFRNTKITIEHIMPQNIDENWKRDLGADFDVVHKKYLHNIGNLILTEFNSEMGNKPFLEKKEKLKTSSLSYRLSIIEESNWNENSIIKHRENMIQMFLETFSISDGYRCRNNWNSKEVEKSNFSPLDDDAGDFAEGSKPAELRINNKAIKATTWQDVFIKLLFHFYKSDIYDFNIILDNQLDIFKKEDTIVRWPALENLIDNNSDLSNRYKTFEGKTWDKVDNLSEADIFIHINISASTCMTRIANIMNKFNLSPDSIEITLK